MLGDFKHKLLQKGSLRTVLEGVVLLLLFTGLRYAFNLLLLPALFPGAELKQDFAFSSAAAVLLALAYWLGLPYFSLFTAIGLILSRALGLHFYLIEGGNYPSLMANVLTTATQGGGFLIGGVSEYALWLNKKMRELRAAGHPEHVDTDVLAEAAPDELVETAADERGGTAPKTQI